MLSSSAFLLAAALMAAPLPQALAQAQAPPAQSPPVVQAPPEQAPPQTEGRRPSERAPRTSRSQPAASDQGLFEEARTSRDGGPTRQELTLTANVLGGYDDNLTAGLGTGSAVAPAAMASGGTAYLDGKLGYYRGNARHSIRMDSTGSLTAYPGYLDDPAAGGVFDLGIKTTAGRDTTFGFSERLGYEPLFNVYSQGASSTPLPPEIGSAVPATGLFERRSLNSSTALSLTQRWSRQDWTSLSYSYRLQEFTEEDYSDNTSHDVVANYRRRLANGVRARVEYGYTKLDYTDADYGAPSTREQRIEGGPEIEKVLSRRRRLKLSLAAGASYLESKGSTERQPYDAWLPTGSASLMFALSPTWSVDGGYTRDLQLFQGVTDEVYTTDTAFVGTGGFVSTRANLRVGATYSNWKTPVASGVADTMDIYGASLQLQVTLSDTIAATASYYYYFHRYSNPGGLPEGFPAEYNRNAVRVGLTMWVPLAGTPQRDQR